jgi:hypothetical protein
MEKGGFINVGILAIIAIISFVMREVVYKNNLSDNWWGTALGVIIVASVCGLIGLGITSLLKFDNWIGKAIILLFVVIGAVIVFLPPLKEAFRVNAILYYFLPVLLAAICSILIFISLIDLVEEIIDMEKFAPFFRVGIIATVIIMSVVMREVVYKDNLAANWWGTVNGVITVAFVGLLLGASISYILVEIFDDGSSKIFTGITIGIGALLFMFIGVIIAFFPPFKQAFRVSVFLYYVMPAISAGLYYLTMILTE